MWDEGCAAKLKRKLAAVLHAYCMEARSHVVGALSSGCVESTSVFDTVTSVTIISIVVGLDRKADMMISE